MLLQTFPLQDDGQPMQAVRAVQVLDEVGDYDVETLLGFPLLTKAEPYTARAQVIKHGRCNSCFFVGQNITKYIKMMGNKRCEMKLKLSHLHMKTSKIFRNPRKPDFR